MHLTPAERDALVEAVEAAKFVYENGADDDWKLRDALSRFDFDA